MTRNRKRERTGNRKKGFRGGTETESQRNRRTTVPVVVPVTLSLSLARSCCGPRRRFRRVFHVYALDRSAPCDVAPFSLWSSSRACYRERVASAQLRSVGPAAGCNPICSQEQEKMERRGMNCLPPFDGFSLVETSIVEVISGRAGTVS
jgi:hypothetical protein